MLKTTEQYAGTIESGSNIDVLSDAMRSLRIAGSILLSEDYAPPWRIAIPEADSLRELLKLPRGVRVVDFHFVQRGHITIKGEDGSEVIVVAGEMAICFGGRPHWIAQGEPDSSVSVETLLASGNNIFEPGPAERARSASLICGVFLMHDVEFNPLFASLPPVIHLSAQRPVGYNLSGLLNQISYEVREKPLGNHYVVERLLELLCAESLRTHLDATTARQKNWFGGLKDPVVGRAISMIHARPGADWTVDRLAGQVAMSASRFAARFTSALGESPMAYVTKWRMNVARRMLRETRVPIGNIALEVGYENLPAFNRAFKKHLGVPPAAWRSVNSDR